MPSSDFRRFLRRVWIPILVLGLSPLFAEGAYRLAGVRVAGTMEGIFERVPGVPLHHRARASVFQTWFSGDFWVHTDTFGFRVAEGEKNGRKDGQSPDLLVLGDSQAFGQGVEYEKSVMGRFAARAREAGLDVGNAAVGGHWVRDQTALVRWLIEQHDLRPACVLVCLSPRGLLNPDAEGKRSRAGSAPGGGIRGGGLASLRNWVKSNSAAYLVLRNALRSDEGRERAWVDLRRMYDTGDVHYRAERLRVRLLEMKASWGDRPPRFFYCYLPLEAGFRIRELASEQGDPPGIVDPLVPKSIVEAAIAGENAPFIDLTEVLDERIRRGDSVTLRGDAHYDEDTSQACSELIWRAMDWAEACRGPSDKGDGNDDGRDR